MSTLKVNSVLDASGGNTATINSMTPTADSLQGFRNRIINGDMGIDQRNAGASINNSAAANTYGVDRFAMYGADASKMSAQQSTTAPTGFVNSWLITSSAATTPSAAQPYGFRQVIEGRNISDLGWGTANAKTITISFWVRSSITGTYALSLFNRDAPNRSYVATYTISSANTFEYKTITIAGDTSGSWNTDNSQGIQVWWDLGSGSNFNETAGSWVSALKVRTSGSSNWIGTSGATFYITGVQLEVGSVATPFERIDYGRELMLCQRYYFRHKATDGNSTFGPGFILTTNEGLFVRYFPVPMRTAPSAIEQSGTAADYRIRYSNTNTNCNGVPSFSTASEYEATWSATVASGTTNGQGAFFRSTNSSAFLGWSVEL
jgi:hypothetical protein